MITGAHGFIGRHVARHMAAMGYTVSGIGHGEWVPEKSKSWGIVNWITADVGLEPLLASGVAPDAVIHCAGSGSVGFANEKPHEDFLRNVGTTAAVLEFMRQRVPEAALVLTSSAAVYGNVTRLPIVETAETQPVSVYGAHKLIAEKLCVAHARLFGTRVAIVRLFSVYGDGLRKQLLWDACRKIRQGETVFAGTGQEQRDWLHVSDAAVLLALAADNASAMCPVVNGGTGKGTHVEEIVRRCFTFSAGAMTPTFSGAGRPGDPPGQVADITRARAWGWSPKVSCDDGVAEYLKWFFSRVAECL
ncbi:MAG: NAD-dependent epimerase/dehydratase family protein [Burkholderiales bacterium]|nr:NAD-dependent epimerase/dehydratase family protein [Burkholderiales bacterium]